MEQTIAQLVARVRQGELDAFGELMARLRPRFGRYAWQMLGTREEAEEALQDTFLRAYRSLASCRDPERFAAWAFQILVNRCRSRRRRLLQRQRFSSPNHAVATAGSVPHPEEERAWREEIDRALARLPGPQREAFLLKHVEGLRYEEIVELTGAAVPALKMRVKRACDALRKLLEGALND